MVEHLLEAPGALGSEYSDIPATSFSPAILVWKQASSEKLAVAVPLLTQLEILLAFWCSTKDLW